MPNRILRDGFVDSEAVNALSDWTHRVYSNLLVKCDDAGRFDGRLEFIRSHLFPLGTTRRAEDFRKAVEEMGGELVIRYEWNGKPFLQVTKWQRCGSATTSRYPWRDGGHRIEYVSRETRDGDKDFVTTSISDGVPTPCLPPADGVASELNTETKTETKTKTGAARASPSIPETLQTPAFEAAWGRWLEYRREIRKPVTPTMAASQLRQMEKWGESHAIATIEHTIGRGWWGLREPEASRGQGPPRQASPPLKGVVMYGKGG
jgi:hypothetical protein